MEPVLLNAEELRKFDGSDRALPIYLAIKGTIFDVSKGLLHAWELSFVPISWDKSSKGGCAKSGCFLQGGNSMGQMEFITDGLDKIELDNLRDWQEKFYSKYKLVGKITK